MPGWLNQDSGTGFAKKLSIYSDPSCSLKIEKNFDILEAVNAGYTYSFPELITETGVYNFFALIKYYGKGDLINENGNYVGSYALEAYSDYIGSIQHYIPIENDHGPGSANVHWEEDVLGMDIMAWAISEDPDYYSRITIESLKDLGYDIIDFGDSNTQLVNYITTAIKQETDYVNEMISSMQLNEDQINNNQIL